MATGMRGRSGSKPITGCPICHLDHSGSHSRKASGVDPTQRRCDSERVPQDFI